MEILEAYDLTGSYRAAAELAGCDHHTVARYVQLREAGQSPVAGSIGLGRSTSIWRRSRSWWSARAAGSARTWCTSGSPRWASPAGSAPPGGRSREVKQRFQAGQRRVFRPWITEPGLWLQWDWGEGPRIGGRRTNLWCAWLAWSRFRVVIPVWDKTLPTIVACLDTTLRRIGGVPTYALTDNEKTVSVDHVARIAVRNPEIVEVGRHYGMTIRTCVPADPQSKGGSEATVRIAKADLVPTEANLLEEYRTFAELETACREFCEQVNDRPHRETRRRPVEALAEERTRLHPLPGQPFTVAFGTTRRVNWDCHDLGGGGALLGAARAGRHPGLGPVPRRRADRHRRRRATARPRSPATPGPRRAPRRSATSTTRRRPRTTDGDRIPRATRGRGSRVPRARPGRGVLAGRGRRGRSPAGPAEDGRGGRAGQAAPGRRGRPGARDRGDRRPVRRERPASASWPTRPAASDAEPTRASEAHSLQPGTSAWSDFGITAPARSTTAVTATTELRTGRRLRPATRSPRRSS